MPATAPCTRYCHASSCHSKMMYFCLSAHSYIGFQTLVILSGTSLNEINHGGSTSLITHTSPSQILFMIRLLMVTISSHLVGMNTCAAVSAASMSVKHPINSGDSNSANLWGNS